MDLADYINEYNDVCPHKALGYKTPSKVFADYFTGMLASRIPEIRFSFYRNRGFQKAGRLSGRLETAIPKDWKPEYW